MTDTQRPFRDSLAVFLNGRGGGFRQIANDLPGVIQFQKAIKPDVFILFQHVPIVCALRGCDL